MTTIKNLIEDLKLGTLTPEAQHHFYRLFENDLSQQVGERMLQEMPENALEEYEQFFAMDFKFVAGWLQKHYPLDDSGKYDEVSALFSQLCPSTANVEECNALKRDIASMLWIKASGVDYSRIVRQVFCEMSGAARDSRSAIIAHYKQDPDNWDSLEYLGKRFVGVASDDHG